MKFFDSILDIIAGNPNERRLSADVASLTLENAKLTKECKELRRHLQSIRIAHEPLQHAIYPPGVGQ